MGSITRGTRAHRRARQACWCGALWKAQVRRTVSKDVDPMHRQRKVHLNFVLRACQGGAAISWDALPSAPSPPAAARRCRAAAKRIQGVVVGGGSCAILDLERRHIYRFLMEKQMNLLRITSSTVRV